MGWVKEPSGKSYLLSSSPKLVGFQGELLWIRWDRTLRGAPGTPLPLVSRGVQELPPVCVDCYRIMGGRAGGRASQRLAHGGFSTDAREIISVIKQPVTAD